MATYSRRKVAKVLHDKYGFEKRSGDHEWHELEISGQIVAATHVSTGGHGQDIDSGLQLLMGRELYLTKRQFCMAIECPLTRAAYYAILSEKHPELEAAIKAAI